MSTNQRKYITKTAFHLSYFVCVYSLEKIFVSGIAFFFPTVRRAVIWLRKLWIYAKICGFLFLFSLLLMMMMKKKKEEMNKVFFVLVSCRMVQPTQESKPIMAFGHWFRLLSELVISKIVTDLKLESNINNSAHCNKTSFF